jgi:hypothetical protein
MEWVSIGPGVVSTDGAKITSRIGHGIRHSGWGGAPPPPDDTCNVKCDSDDECVSSTKTSKPCSCKSKFLEGNTKSEQVDGDCKTALCGGSRDDSSDKPENVEGDCKKPACKGGSPGTDEDLSDNPEDGSDADAPNDCVNEICEGPPEPDDSEKPDAECTKCQGGSSVEDDSHTPKSDAYQDPADCKLLFCDGTDESKDESANLPDDELYNCKMDACADGSKESIDDLDDTKPDSDFNDCKLPSCNDEGFEFAPEQHKEEEKEECKITRYRCDALSNTSIVDDATSENIPQGTLVEDNKCKVCDGNGQADEIDLGPEISATITKSLPSGISSAVQALAGTFGASANLTTSYGLKGTIKDCCSEDSGLKPGGIQSGSFIIDVKPKPIDELLWPKIVPRIEARGVADYFGQRIEVLAEGDIGIFLVGSIGFVGSIGLETDECKGSGEPCLKASMAAKGDLGLEPRAELTACLILEGHVDYQQCVAAKVGVNGEGGFTGQVTYGCTAGVSGELCSNGVTAKAFFSAMVNNDGEIVEVKGELPMPAGPYFKTCK